MRTYFINLSAALICLTIASPSAASVVSKRLTDVIPANGKGVINVFDVSGNGQDLTSADIEAFRQDNNGALAFAIDVNEAANGTEKASSQGVSIAQLRLEAVIDGKISTFTEYWTQTQSLLATKGNTSRSTYFTLIGDTGSSRITSNSTSGIYGSDFDATVYVSVPQELGQATAITLYINFLDTNVQLGDPEAFYDYSNGYEDVAIVSAEDAAYLDQVAAGQQEAPLVISPSDTDLSKASTAYFPSASGFYLSAFEDRFPSRGDYDFNDLVVAYRIAYGYNKYGKIVDVFGEGYLVAKGALFDLDWGLAMTFGSVGGLANTKVFAPNGGMMMSELSQESVFSGNINLQLLSNTSELWTPYEGSSFVNTEAAIPLTQGHKFQFSIQLDSPVDPSTASTAPFSPYLYVHQTQQLILSGMAFQNDQGYPFGLIMPENWRPPTEQTDIGKAYPELVTFIKSSGKSGRNWYDNSNNQVMLQLTPAYWKW
ncbi:MAG: LruC domain-containing protein [Hahellaceae bacterium]|nr:LruC domain-containing protein [Hahellaceae bacterium]MCP5210241.1 LruC domain-containing protein [Hahellaceae bacterium]